MTATPHITPRRLALLLAAAVALVMAVPLYRSFASGSSSATVVAADADDELDGRDEREPVTNAPTVEAAFDAQSYRVGGTAKLVLFDSARSVRLQLFRVGAIRGMLTDRDRMRGLPVGTPVDLGAVTPGRTVSIQLGPWPSALYFATLTAPGGRIGYAPFVLAPRRLGEHKVAVVLPTETWQAYNFRDDDGNGTSDTWYAGGANCTARLARPFENRGVPPHYRYYDEPFLRWLAIHAVQVDFISDAELNTASGAKLARSCNLLIFSGHHEYVTKHEFDAVTEFRNCGGNLMFLSANNFFWMITINNGTMTRIEQWRDLGRPEAALIGVQYYANDLGQHRASWTVKASSAGKWIFAGTGLTAGSQLSSGGIEADDVQPASPRNVQVLAQIENLFGDGRNAQMTYYTTPAGAKVFAAGAFSLACSIWQPPVSRMTENLLAVLSKP